MSHRGVVGKGIRNHLDDVTSVSLSFDVESKTEFDSAVRTIKRQTTVHAVRPGLTRYDKDLSSRIEVVLLFCCFIQDKCTVVKEKGRGSCTFSCT